MFGKTLKNVSSAVKRVAQSAPKPAPKLPALSRLAPKFAPKPAPKPTPKPPALVSARSVLAGMMKKGGSVSSKRAVKVKPKGRKS